MTGDRSWSLQTDHNRQELPDRVEGVMLGPALLQLFSDLAEISDRSDYEEALYQELKPLA